MSESRFVINPKVLLGVPSLEKHPLSWQWLDAYMAIDFPLGSSAIRYKCFGKPVDEARNDIVERALAENCDYVLFLSDDVLPPPNFFQMLLRHREHMVTGVYWTKTHPSRPYLFDGLLNGPYEDWKVGEYFPVDWAGCDCLLVHTDVFKAMERPWFSCDWTYSGSKVYHPTEDAYFYAKAREAGFRLYCDSEVQCLHQDRNTGLLYGLRQDMTRYQPGGELLPGDNEQVLVADLGAGAVPGWFGSQAQVTRFDASGEFEPDVRCDVRCIPAAADSFDIVHASHILEHFAPFETVDLLKEWRRIVKPGGKLIVKVPNLGFAARKILEAEQGVDVGIYPLWQLYGEQHGRFNEVHKNGFTQRSLASALEAAGLSDVETELIDGETSVQGTAVKAAAEERQPVLQEMWQRAERLEAGARGGVVEDRILATVATAEPATVRALRDLEAKRGSAA